jgi:hypothetical protein
VDWLRNPEAWPSGGDGDTPLGELKGATDVNQRASEATALPDRTREKEHDWLSLVSLSQEHRSTEQARLFDTERTILLAWARATQARLRVRERRMGRDSCVMSLAIVKCIQIVSQ